MILPLILKDMIVRHLEEGKPLEACGLIGGQDDVAASFYPCVNTAQSPTFFTIAPGEILRVLRAMDEKGEDLIGIVHSHPATAAIPSPTDVLHAHYPESTYVIVSLKDPEPDIRGYRIKDKNVREEAIVIAQ